MCCTAILGYNAKLKGLWNMRKYGDASVPQSKGHVTNLVTTA